jgi:hypothetical protein
MIPDKIIILYPTHLQASLIEVYGIHRSVSFGKTLDTHNISMIEDTRQKAAYYLMKHKKNYSNYGD